MGLSKILRVGVKNIYQIKKKLGGDGGMGNIFFLEGHMSHVERHMSHVERHMLHVTCH